MEHSSESALSLARKNTLPRFSDFALSQPVLKAQIFNFPGAYKADEVAKILCDRTFVSLRWGIGLARNMGLQD